mmetsp:Transcript_32551/g.69328  ORF Transcript_32551/g.69328 Transcript_32551/m.69328 type:complete len:247 (-) Transcript_32551:364-1104(-)
MQQPPGCRVGGGIEATVVAHTSQAVPQHDQQDKSLEGNCCSADQAPAIGDLAVASAALLNLRDLEARNIGVQSVEGIPVEGFILVAPIQERQLLSVIPGLHEAEPDKEACSEDVLAKLDSSDGRTGVLLLFHDLPFGGQQASVVNLLLQISELHGRQISLGLQAGELMRGVGALLQPHELLLVLLVQLLQLVELLLRSMPLLEHANLALVFLQLPLLLLIRPPGPLQLPHQRAELLSHAAHLALEL